MSPRIAGFRRGLESAPPIRSLCGKQKRSTFKIRRFDFLRRYLSRQDGCQPSTEIFRDDSQFYCVRAGKTVVPARIGGPAFTRRIQNYSSKRRSLIITGLSTALSTTGKLYIFWEQIGCYEFPLTITWAMYFDLTVEPVPPLRDMV